MRGIELFSDLFLLFILIIVVIIVTSLVWVFTEIKVVGSALGIINPREATIRILFNPVKYESTLLTFLELRHDGIPMKKILNAVAIQNNTTVWLPDANGGKGDFIDASVVSKNFLDEIIKSNIYLLKIRDPEIIIVESGSSSRWQKTSTELFLLDGKPVDLDLYVG